MKCERATCRAEATRRVVATLTSGRRIDECLCAEHGRRTYEGLLARPVTLSGSCTPLAGKVAA